jgi:hypothetical protein
MGWSLRGVWRFKKEESTPTPPQTLTHIYFYFLDPPLLLFSLKYL